MRRHRLKKKHTPVDTSDFAHPKPHKHRDDAYLKSYKGRTCRACGRRDGTVVGAHINYMNFGAQSRNHDYYTAALCGACHRSHDTWPGGIADWWMQHFIMPMLKRDYEAWNQ